MDDQRPTKPAKSSNERQVFMWQKPEGKSVPDDFKEIASIPCAKQSLEKGIIGAALAGAGRNFKSAANFAVTFGLIVSAGAFEYCNMNRKMERIAMKKIIEVHNEQQGTENITVGPPPKAVARPPAPSGAVIDMSLTREQREAAMIKAREAEQAKLRKAWWKFW
ncbi:hypothetical protein HOO65_020399 [Ceratocystis lukuohia]|uniref:Cytochrome c oxidase assembly protein COX20, mitochondrial n=1 Tax=Ceratocystis lukuohia TaxID=2019550 RepID=A0ABR4MNJ3_9PEZI